MNYGLKVLGQSRYRGVAPPPPPPPPPSGYGAYKTVTIDHTKVPSTQTSIPILITLTATYLKTVANGGSVTSSSGYDIIPSTTTTSDGSGLMTFELDTYDPVNGIVNLWVLIPSLSSSTNTVIYLLYGNSAVTTNQGNAPATWANNYLGVWHFGNGTSLSLVDSVTGATSTPHGSPAAGAGFNSGGALALHGSVGEYIDTGASYDRIISSNYTQECWVNPAPVYSSNPSNPLFMVMSNENNTGCGLYVGNESSPNMAVFYYVLNGGSEDDFTISSGVTPNVWQHIVGTTDTGNVNRTYLNGINGATGYYARGAANANLIFGYYPRGLPNAGNFWLNGLVDEARTSSVQRSGDWITTQYNNTSSPSTFYTVT